MDKVYDSEQRRAIEADGGYWLVLAPPGCGKTDILSERVATASRQGIAPEDMLCLTFTNRASRGMRQRVEQKVGQDTTGQLFVGNVHRYCSNFLFGQSLIAQSTAILDDDEITEVLYDMSPQFFTNGYGQPDRQKTALVSDIDAYMTQRILQHDDNALCMPKEKFEAFYTTAVAADMDASNVSPLHEFVKYALCLRQYKRERRLMDFNDLLIQTYEYLRNDTSGQFKRYKWLQVDEVQDLNALQMAIVDQLTNTTCAGGFTAMYLGDEQQAIFSFTGAKLSSLDRLKDRCRGHVLTLGRNYRSPKYLLDIFNTYAATELGVSPELLPQYNDDKEHGRMDLILTGNGSTSDESRRLPRMTDYYTSLSTNERTAIIVPTNAAADRMSDVLTTHGISHFKISGTDYFKSRSYKTLSSMLCVAANEHNAQSWARLIHGTGATTSVKKARALVDKLKELMMTPQDLADGESYTARFDRAYRQREFVFFDTETTGLDVQCDDIVQIAAFKVRDGQRIDGSDLNILMHTDKPLPDKVGGGDNPLLEMYAMHSHMTRADGLQLFLDYVGTDPVMGHNVGYDYRILQSNVRRTLGMDITLEVYDSLHLIKCVSPWQRMYKLGFLVGELGLAGKNSHLADEDISATKALVDYCCAQFRPQLKAQEDFMQLTRVRNISRKLQPVCNLIGRLRYVMNTPSEDATHTLSGCLRHVQEQLEAMGISGKSDGTKFDTFVRFVQGEWETSGSTLSQQIAAHATELAAGISEGDLVNSDGLISERIFIMTVYKAKGLEFDNVIILEANDGTYPFFTVNKVLGAPWRHTKAELAEAQQERMEDARKFYVALSRARKRLCISYSMHNSYGIRTRLTPFMQSIAHFFHTGK